MGKQIEFLMDKEDECIFCNLILEQGLMLFKGSNPSPIQIKKLPEPFTEDSWFKIHLYKTEFGKLKLSTTANGIEYIDEVESPVVEFFRTVVRNDDKIISRGRLYVVMKYYNQEGTQVEKVKDLNEWYNTLSKWIKKNLPKQKFSVNGYVYEEYISESLLHVAQQGFNILG